MAAINPTAALLSDNKPALLPVRIASAEAVHIQRAGGASPTTPAADRTAFRQEATMQRSETLAETMVITRNFPRPSQRDSRSLGRRLVITVAAAATALGLLASTAVPARADNDDLAKALAALAIVGILVNEQRKSRERERARAQQHHKPHPHHQQPSRHPRVPSVCAIEIAGNSGTATVYGERCLREQGFNFRLPEYCARTARIYGRNDRIYSDQCLRDAGFRVAGSGF